MSFRKLAKSALVRARLARIRALALPRRSAWLRRRLRLPSNEIFDPLANEFSGRTRVLRLDAGYEFVRPLPLISAADATALPFFKERARESISPSYVVELEGGVAWGHPTGGVFTADGRFVPALTHDPCGASFHAAWTRLNFPRPRRLHGRALYLVTPEATDNFHHWLIDLLPRLGLVQRAGYTLDEFDHIIVNHRARAYQHSTLAHVGIRPEQLVVASADLLVRPDVLVAPSLKPVNQTFPAADLAFLRETFLPHRAAMVPGRKIFLSRRDAASRRLRNEAELQPLLAAQGFEVVSLAGLDVAAQASLFAEAEIIAGPAGAAFANVAFASPGARVIEIAPPQWLAAFHWMVSARLGVEHTILLGEGAVMRGVPDSSARHEDLHVDPAKLADALGASLVSR